MAHAGAHGLCEPVGVHAAEHVAQFVGIGVVKTYLCQGIVRAEETRHLLHLQFLRGVAEVVAAQVGHFHVYSARIGDAHLALLGPFGLDDDHAVGGLRTIDGLGGGVLQRGDALHLVHVEVEYLGQLGFKSVEDEERLVGTGGIFSLHTGDGRGSAHLEVGQGVGVAARSQVLYLHERGVDVLQALQHVAVAHLLQVGTLHGGYGSRKGIGLSGEGSVHHHFFHLLAVGREGYRHIVCGAHILGRHTDIRHHESCPAGPLAEGEVSVHIGHHHFLGAHDSHGSSDDGHVVVGRHHGTSEGSLLVVIRFLRVAQGHVHQVALVGIFKRLAVEQHLNHAVEFLVFHASAHLVAFHVVVGKHNLTTTHLLQPLQGRGEVLILEAHRDMLGLSERRKQSDPRHKHQCCHSVFHHKFSLSFC